MSTDMLRRLTNRRFIIIIITSGKLAVILDFQHTVMSYDIGSTTAKKVDPENDGVAVGTFSLCAMCSRTQDMPGGNFTPPPCRQTSQKSRCRDKG